MLGIAALVFYWIPLTSPETTPHWDTIDYHQGVLAHFVDSIRSLQLPYWTNFTYSGYPFLSDPQTGVWYPGNWLLLVTGAGPKALEFLLVLHCLWAGAGAMLFASQWVESRLAQVFAALLYMFCGYFAAHSSHLGMFETASWFPWLLYGVHVSFASASIGPVLLSGLAAGCVVLIGHFQTALYAGTAVALYAAALLIRSRDLNRIFKLAGIAVVGVAVSAVGWMPATALVSESARSGMGFSTQTNGILMPRALGTLVIPNLFHAVKGAYDGPPDITQYYYYGGLLLIPFAVVGLVRRELLPSAVALVVLPIWFAFGPGTGLYDVAMLVPGFSRVRAPVHAWFVAALGLSLLAAAGASQIGARFRKKWVLPCFALIVFADLLYWNSRENQLAYERTSYQERYGAAEQTFTSAVRPALPAGTRFHSPVDSASFGPLNGSLSNGLEVTYGYNPLPLARYLNYYSAAQKNTRLVAGLSAGLSINVQTGALEPSSTVLPRFSVPKVVSSASGTGYLDQLDPTAGSFVEGSIEGISQDPAARVEIVSESPSEYKLRYHAATPTLVRAAIPTFPGWKAIGPGGELPVRIVDHAFIGIVVPQGEGDILLRFRPPYFSLGASISVLTLLTVIVLASGRLARKVPAAAGGEVLR